MEDRAVDAVTLAGSQVAHDLSMWGLFIHADFVVKMVIFILAFASIWSWAIMFDKWSTLKKLHARAKKFETAFWSGESLEKLYQRIHDKPGDPMARVFVAAMSEWKMSTESGGLDKSTLRAGLQQRIERVMANTITREVNGIEKHLTFLATVGSTATFIGLFGTVWGIMTSFSAIASAQNTSLAVVAPGIAEALFATALGLIAAIPAVVAYNKFSGDVGRYADRLDGFSAEFSAILSRHFEQHGA